MERWTSNAGLLRIQDMAMNGLTPEEICQHIGISTRTFRRWRDKEPGIDRALENGRETAVAAVTNALFKKAVGGDVWAMRYYLQNRDPEHWCEHPELRGSTGKVVFVDDIPRVSPRQGGNTGAQPGAGSGAAADQPDRP